MLFATPALYTVTRITRTRVVIHTRAAAERKRSRFQMCNIQSIRVKTFDTFTNEPKREAGDYFEGNKYRR